MALVRPDDESPGDAGPERDVGCDRGSRPGSRREALCDACARVGRGERGFAGAEQPRSSPATPPPVRDLRVRRLHVRRDFHLDRPRPHAGRGTDCAARCVERLVLPQPPVVKSTLAQAGQGARRAQLRHDRLHTRVERRDRQPDHARDVTRARAGQGRIAMIARSRGSSRSAARACTRGVYRRQHRLATQRAQQPPGRRSYRARRRRPRPRPRAAARTRARRRRARRVCAAPRSSRGGRARARRRAARPGRCDRAAGAARGGGEADPANARPGTERSSACRPARTAGWRSRMATRVIALQSGEADRQTTCVPAGGSTWGQPYQRGRKAEPRQAGEHAVSPRPFCRSCIHRQRTPPADRHRHARVARRAPAPAWARARAGALRARLATRRACRCA